MAPGSALGVPGASSEGLGGVLGGSSSGSQRARLEAPHSVRGHSARGHSVRGHSVQGRSVQGQVRVWVPWSPGAREMLGLVLRASSRGAVQGPRQHGPSRTLVPHAGRQAQVLMLALSVAALALARGLAPVPAALLETQGTKEVLQQSYTSVLRKLHQIIGDTGARKLARRAAKKLHRVVHGAVHR